MNILYIDTASNEEVIIKLKIDKKEYKEKRKINFNRAEVVLPMIESILRKHKLSLNDLNSIQVNAGPGSFTGIRVGVSIANALGFALKIPVNNKKVGELVEALYD